MQLDARPRPATFRRAWHGAGPGALACQYHGRLLENGRATVGIVLVDVAAMVDHAVGRLDMFAQPASQGS